MNPDQALSVLDQAAARAPLTRDEHATVLRALACLREAVQTPQPQTPAEARHG